MKALSLDDPNHVGLATANDRFVDAQLIKANSDAAAAIKVAEAASPSSTLAAVATSGSYLDLVNRPALPSNTPAVTHDFLTSYNSSTGGFTKAQPDWTDLTGKPTFATIATSGLSSDLTPNTGITASRPGSPAVGTMYFDTTIGKPIWFKSPGWVLADGTAA